MRHIARFISGIWQIHPFCEGNTRTTAVFAIKYLRSLGYAVDNEPFKAHSWYFRNALVRANYDDLDAGVVSDLSFLEQFFENLLMGTHHVLRNRYLHVDWREELLSLQVTSQIEASIPQAALEAASSQGETINETINVDDQSDVGAPTGIVVETSRNEQVILSILAGNPSATYGDVVSITGFSRAKVGRIIQVLSNRGLVERVGSRKSGSWVVLDGVLK